MVQPLQYTKIQMNTFNSEIITGKPNIIKTGAN